LPLDAHELRRLSPAAVFSRSLIGATLSASEQTVWGLIHSGPQWLQSLRGGRPRHQTVPEVLMIAATGPRTAPGEHREQDVGGAEKRNRVQHGDGPV
jgi:hypothetical protein